MASQLRHIAVHVTEPKVGDFRWVLTEQAADHSWSAIRTARVQSETYREAMADGLIALQSIVDNLDEGPRHSSASPKEVRAQPLAGSQATERVSSLEPDTPFDEETPVKAKRSVFGFGLAN